MTKRGGADAAGAERRLRDDGGGTACRLRIQQPREPHGQRALCEGEHDDLPLTEFVFVGGACDLTTRVGPPRAVLQLHRDSAAAGSARLNALPASAHHGFHEPGLKFFGLRESFSPKEA